MAKKPTPKAEPKVEEKEPVTGLALLREPFEPHQISKLPKPTKRQTEDLKAAQNRKDFSLGIKCDVCGAWHHKDVIHLDYVGHAALTDRLLDCDQLWNWEPVAVDEKGAPLLDRNGGMWIRLTVCGVTRLGYGDAPGKNGGNAVKEVIGDSLRNAAMRFGAALDLWHKGDLHGLDDEPPEENGNGNGNQDNRQQDDRQQDNQPPQDPPEVKLAEKLLGAIKSAENFAMADSIKNDPNYRRDVERLTKMNEKTGAHVIATMESRMKELEFDGDGA